MILADLYRSNSMSSNFSEEIKSISHRYEKVDYPEIFVNSVIIQFQDKSNERDIVDFDDYIIPPNFFNIPKSFILIEFPFCQNNEIKSNYFLKKFHRFNKDCFEVAIKWKTRQFKALFPLKDKSIHPSCVIYKGLYSCRETYIGETIHNASVRWEEHNNPNKMSELAKHFQNNFHHVFIWVILCKAPQNYKVRRKVEASFIASLNLC